MHVIVINCLHDPVALEGTGEKKFFRLMEREDTISHGRDQPRDGNREVKHVARVQTLCLHELTVVGGARGGRVGGGGG